MKNMKIILCLMLIASQVNAAVVSNFIGREIPQRVDVSATAASTTIGSVTFTDAGDLVTFNKHGLAAGAAVAFGTITSTTGISTNTTYYVINPTTNTFQLASTPGGAALPLTTNGTGVLSTSYYAVVHATVRNGGTFSVDGTVFLTSNTWSALGYGNGLFRTPGTPTILANGNGTRYSHGVLLTGSTTVNASSANETTTTAVADISASSGNGSLTDSQATSNTSMVDVFSSSTAMTSVNETFKVPVGTVIVGSGNASYVIEIIKI